MLPSPLQSVFGYDSQNRNFTKRELICNNFSIELSRNNQRNLGRKISRDISEEKGYFRHRHIITIKICHITRRKSFKVISYNDGIHQQQLQCYTIRMGEKKNRKMKKAELII